MEAILLMIGVIVHFALVLLPYYVAYIIIEPSSFLGSVGVFLLGSVIIPLTQLIAVLIMQFLGAVFRSR